MRKGVKRYSYSIRGFVQGVGFRYRAKQAADYLGFTGWVCNEWDDSVSMELQGPPELIDKFFEAVQRGSYIEIRDIRKTEIPVIDDEYGFHVR